ncbi:MAG TPA: hypothetical protein VMR76_02945, partial [Candidatus Saccharimonadia bacterium]|nr:hypothetical protein [Candidatus Saccharimonadia bacterium]
MGKVSATSFSDNSSYTVTAEVLPTRYIIINNSKKILALISNTNKNVVPKVVLNSIKSTPIKLSPDISSQYSYLLKTYKIPNNGDGQLYFYHVSKTPQKPSIKEQTTNLKNNSKTISNNTVFFSRLSIINQLDLYT